MESEVAQVAADLRAAISLTGLARTMAAPVQHNQLLELIVKTAAHVLRARAGSLLLLDEARQELIFTVSATEDVAQLRDIRVPLGTGIAGMVALTGQPMAVADAQSDPRHASDIAERTGLLPHSLLCVPLQHDDAVIGVLELLDKQGAPFFDGDDIHALSLFANQAAIAIELSRAQQDLAKLLVALVGSVGVTDEALTQRVAGISKELQFEPSFLRSAELAALIHELAGSGPEATELTLSIMRAVSNFIERGS